jgi:hypothetical protein
MRHLAFVLLASLLLITAPAMASATETAASCQWVPTLPGWFTCPLGYGALPLSAGENRALVTLTTPNVSVCQLNIWGWAWVSNDWDNYFRQFSINDVVPEQQASRLLTRTRLTVVNSQMGAYLSNHDAYQYRELLCSTTSGALPNSVIATFGP